MTIDTKSIRAAAEAATPGPWEYRQLEWGNYVTADGQTSVCQGALSNTASMIHIATANPATILALLDRLEAAEKDAARYRWLKRERVESNYEGELSIEFECGFDHWNDIDAAIDAAMKDEQK